MDEDERSIHSLIIRYLVAHTKCSGCDRGYTAQDVRIYDHRGDIWLASVTCKHCGLQGLIMAAITTKDAQDVAAVIDPETEDLAVFEQMGAISGDEVLDFHCFVEHFQGDIRQLLEESSGQS